MTSLGTPYDLPENSPRFVVREDDIEIGFIGKLIGLKYEHRSDIRDRATLEANFREKFEALNRVHLTDTEFSRLLKEIIIPDVFTAARPLRQMNSFTGSGKTLTSFKSSTLLKDNPDIEKRLFVVDRKDLDRQTREEFAPPMTINALN